MYRIFCQFYIHNTPKHIFLVITYINDTTYDTRYLLSGSLPQLQIVGAEQTIDIDKPTDISCHIDYYLVSDVTFTWYLAHENMPGRHEESPSRTGNIGRYRSHFDHKFTPGEHLTNVTCKFLANNDIGEFAKTTYVTVRLQCKSYQICGILSLKMRLCIVICTISVQPHISKSLESYI